MDPLTFSTSFAAIIGLLATFRQEKNSAAELTHRDFIEWLENHRHEEIKNLILRTADMRNDVDIFLKEDHDKMIIKLEEISSVLSSIVGRLDGFSGIAKHFSSELVISDQGYYLLKTLERVMNF